MSVIVIIGYYQTTRIQQVGIYQSIQSKKLLVTYNCF
jgi:hypothetical protein